MPEHLARTGSDLKLGREAKNLESSIRHGKFGFSKFNIDFLISTDGVAITAYFEKSASTPKERKSSIPADFEHFSANHASANKNT